jgi:hypothetical protein
MKNDVVELDSLQTLHLAGWRRRSPDRAPTAKTQ